MEFFMSDMLIQLLLFSTKALIMVAFILVLFVGIIAILGKAKEQLKGRITIKNLNQKYEEIKESLLEEILTKDQFKKFLKTQKALDKEKKKLQHTAPQKNVFVLNFSG